MTDVLLDPTIRAWVLTYLAHSTLIIAAAWLFTRRMPARLDAMAESIWRTALVAPFVSASVQLSLGVMPLGGAFVVGSANATVAADVAPAIGDPRPFRERAAPDRATSFDAARSVDVTPGADRAVARPGVVDGARAANGSPDGSIEPADQAPMHAIAPGRVAAIALLAVVGLAAIVRSFQALLSWRQLRRLVRGRFDVEAGPFAGSLARLRRRAGYDGPIRLTAAAGLRVPIAFGTVHPEICVPASSLGSAAPSERESMIAHELAHLMRRDPIWVAVMTFVEAVAGVQPMNRLATRHLRELAEYRADALAAELVGDRVAIARCLTDVAQRLIAPAPRVGLAMSVSRSGLGRRVHRLLDPAPRPRGGREMGVVLAIAMTAAAVLAAPGARDGRVGGDAADGAAARALGSAAARALGSEAGRGLGSEPLPGPARVPDTRIDRFLPELHALESELSALRAALRDAHADDPAVAAAAALEAQVEDVRRRAERLATLLPAEFGVLDPSNPPHPDPTTSTPPRPGPPRER